MRRELYKIPGKVVGHHDPDLNVIIDTWTSLFVTLQQWQSTVYQIGIVDYAPKNGVTAWVIDTSHARSVFPPEVQEFRRTVAKPKLEQNGVKYLFVVTPPSGIGKFSAGKTAELYDDDKDGLKSYEVTSVEEALEMLRREKSKDSIGAVS
ncbi:MAG: hypothetical protein AAGA85_14680 [Bacteroidota bacterium]